MTVRHKEPLVLLLSLPTSHDVEIYEHQQQNHIANITGHSRSLAWSGRPDRVEMGRTSDIYPGVPVGRDGRSATTWVARYAVAVLSQPTIPERYSCT